MAIAIFDKMNDQQTRKGQKLGISSFEAWGARFIMACAACVGAYHIGNVLTIEALSDNPNTFMLCACSATKAVGRIASRCILVSRPGRHY